jgi:hypothetical protein
MSASEGWPDDASIDPLSELDWNTPEVKPNDPLLRRIYDVASKRFRFPQLIDEHSTLSLSTFPEGNRLGIEVDSTDNNMRFMVPLGYFWGGEYVIYEELVDWAGWGDAAEDIRRLQVAGLTERAKWLTDFNATESGVTRFDTGHWLLQTLHKAHHEILGGDILDAMLQWRNDNPRQAEHEQTPPAPLRADSSTRAVVRFLPVTNGYETDEDGKQLPRVVGHTLSAAIVGAYTETPNGMFKIRHDPEDIDVAVTQDDDLDMLLPGDFHLINDMLTEEQLDDMVYQAEKVDYVAGLIERRGGLFDKRMLGANVYSLAWIDLVLKRQGGE